MTHGTYDPATVGLGPHLDGAHQWTATEPLPQHADRTAWRRVRDHHAATRRATQEAAWKAAGQTEAFPVKGPL